VYEDEFDFEIKVMDISAHVFFDFFIVRRTTKFQQELKIVKNETIIKKE